MTGVNICFASGLKPQKKTYFVKIFRKSFVNAQKNVLIVHFIGIWLVCFIWQMSIINTTEVVAKTISMWLKINIVQKGFSFDI